ncbi:MAG: hypothetical protein ACI8SA_002019, partial [Dokdonia sp.]
KKTLVNTFITKQRSCPSERRGSHFIARGPVYHSL